MKKISTAAVRQNRNFSEQKLTIGFDLGDRWSWYCVLDETGSVLLEQRNGRSRQVRERPDNGSAWSRQDFHVV
jgi:hypothetical protein